MPASRALLALSAVILVAGGIVLQFFIILSGLDSTPLNRVYFLQASTDGITGGNDQYQNPARWTYLDICGVEGGRNANCGPTRAAIPFDPSRNFGTDQGVPETFNGNTYYYLSRVAWAFYLIALFFAVVTFFISLAAYFARLGAYMTGLFAMLAFMSQAVAAALMTAWTVRARNAWRSNGNDSNLGTYAYGFTWGSVAAFLIATILFCAAGSVGKEKKQKSGGYFGRKTSTRSRNRGSFIDSSSDRRVVKDDSSFDRRMS